MVKDNKLRLDPRFKKDLQMKALEKGFRSARAYTKDLMDKKEMLIHKGYKRKKNDKTFW